MLASALASLLLVAAPDGAAALRIYDSSAGAVTGTSAGTRGAATASGHALLGLVAPPTRRDPSGKPFPLPPGLVPRFSFERLAPSVRSRPRRRRLASTTRVELVAERPGEPPVKARSESRFVPPAVPIGCQTYR